MSEVTSDQKLDDNEPPPQPASAELERRKKIEAKMFKNQKRHYKKDTRYVLDLYTIAYDEDETVESVGTIICKPETTFNLFGGGVGSSRVANSAISSHYFEASHAPLTKSKSQPSFDFHSLASSFSCSSSVTDFSLNNPVSASAVSAVTAVKKASLHAEARLRDSTSDGPTSLPTVETAEATVRKKSSAAVAAAVSAASLASLETNLHKILARKFADEMSKTDSSWEQSGKKVEELSFQKAKLLTKAYYRLLRGANDDSQQLDHRQLDPAAVGPASLQVGLSKKSSVGNSALTSSSTAAGKDSGAGSRGVKKSSASAIILRNSVVYHKNKEDFDRKRWQALINADVEELRKMVEGLGNTAQALNEYLVTLLVERDDLLSKQDDMLEEISELADTLLQK